jgi:hypothetical protein
MILARDVIGFETRGPVRAVLLDGSGQIEARALCISSSRSERHGVRSQPEHRSRRSRWLRLGLDGWRLPAASAYGLASYTALISVSLARRKRVRPAWVATSRILASPAWPPSASPTSCDSDAGVHSRVEKP